MFWKGVRLHPFFAVNNVKKTLESNKVRRQLKEREDEVVWNEREVVKRRYGGGEDGQGVFLCVIARLRGRGIERLGRLKREGKERGTECAESEGSG